MPHPDWLFDILTPDQWRDWRARYESQPWGEQRQDMRLLVSAVYQMMPHSGRAKVDLPNPTYPYFENANDPDELDRLWEQAVERDKELQAKWAAAKLARTADGQGNDINPRD